MLLLRRRDVRRARVSALHYVHRRFLRECGAASTFTAAPAHQTPAVAAVALLLSNVAISGPFVSSSGLPARVRLDDAHSLVSFVYVRHFAFVVFSVIL